MLEKDFTNDEIEVDNIKKLLVKGGWESLKHKKNSLPQVGTTLWPVTFSHTFVHPKFPNFKKKMC